MRLPGANYRFPQRVSAAEVQQEGPQEVVDRLVLAQPLQRPGVLRQLAPVLRQERQQHIPVLIHRAGPPCHASACQDTPATLRKQVSAYGVESRPPLRPTGVFLAVVRRRDRHRRAPGGANVDGLQAVAPHPPGQVAHEGARRVANRGGAHRALQHGGEEGAEELVRDGPQLLFALLRFLCRPGRWSTRLKLQRPPEGSAQVDGNVAKIDLAARGVDGALVHFNAPSWAVRAVMSSTTLPVCPKTGSTSPSLTVHLCLTHCSGKSGMRPRRKRTGRQTRWQRESLRTPGQELDRLRQEAVR